MKYLVSIEACPYFLWQIEILIESFKMHDIDDDLIIAVATRDKGIVPGKNFYHHPHKIYHTNRRFKEGPYFNKPYAAIAAIQNGFVKDDFVLIDPDMILIRPVKKNDANVVFSTDPFYTKELVENEGFCLENSIKEIISEKGAPIELKWPFPGGVYQFHNTDNVFFERVLHWGEKFKNNDPNPNRYSSKIAWGLTLIEFFDSYNIVPQMNECSMVDFHLVGNFVHYYHGLPPFFNKMMFPMGVLGSMSDKTPYDAMIEHNPNLTTDYVRKVITSMNK